MNRPSAVGRGVRCLIDANRSISRWQTRLARQFGRTNGWHDFRQRIVPALLGNDMSILDVGGGKAPQLDRSVKQHFQLHVTGVDISADELAQAPADSYDSAIVGDVATTDLGGPYDLILSTTVLEHVADIPAAVTNMTAALRPGGLMAHFLPCRRAPFAIANRMLGNAVARRILFALFPEKRTYGGFPAYYDRCVPSQLKRLCEQHGLEHIRAESYFASEYLSFCAPMHAVDVIRQLSFQKLGLSDFCETMAIIARKPAGHCGRARRQAA